MKCLCPNLIFSMPLVQLDIASPMTIGSAEYVRFRILLKLRHRRATRPSRKSWPCVKRLRYDPTADGGYVAARW